MNFRTLIFTLGMFTCALGQQNVQNIYLVDDRSLESIPFVYVFEVASNQAYQSDLFGKINLLTNQAEQNFYTYHMSYESLTFRLNEQSDTIFLAMSRNIIPAVTISDHSAIQIIEKAIVAIPEIFPQSKTYLEGNYKQIHNENDKYVRYIEAEVSIEKQGYAPSIKQNQEEKFAISHLRKSFNYEMNGEQHGDHLADLFAEDPIQYLSSSFLNINNLSLYDWSILEKHNNYWIQFQNKPWDNPRNLIGTVIIDPSNYAILGTTVYEIPNPKQRNQDNKDWEFISSWMELTFRIYGDIYMIDKISKNYTHHVRAKNNPQFIEYEVIEEFYWKTYSAAYTIPIGMTYKFGSNLYSKNLDYLENQWLENEHIGKTREDLEHTYCLEYQFSHP